MEEKDAFRLNLNKDGWHPYPNTKYEAYRATRTFKHHEDKVTDELYKHWLEDRNEFIRETRRFAEQVSETLQTEKNFSIHDSDCAWDIDTLKDEAQKNIPKKQQ